MNSLTIDIPDSAVGVFGNDDAAADSILNAAVVKWYELGRISQGRAAEILGLSRSEFLDLLRSFEVSAWQYTGDEIDQELALD